MTATGKLSMEANAFLEDAQDQLRSIAADACRCASGEAVVPLGFEAVDMYYFTVHVNVERAESRQAEFRSLFQSLPKGELLSYGFSYLDLARVVGNHEVALKLMALGEVLGFWQVITPRSFKIPVEEADKLAKLGVVLTSGFVPYPPPRLI